MRRWMMAAGMLGLCVCAAHGGGLKGEIASDRKAIGQQKSEMKGNAQEAHGEEAALREQLRDAVRDGDVATANDLRAQLRNVHRGNVSEKESDKAELGAARRELKRDLPGRHGKGPMGR